jgi:thiosulfate reductase cytochrome b subunit
MESQHHHPLWTRTLHACNAALLIGMASSGLQIYNANPVFGGRAGEPIPSLFTLGGWLAGGRWWHFGLMGVFAFVLGSWLLLLMQWRRQRLGRGGDLETLSASANAKKRNYAIHKILYTLMLVVLSLALLTGLAMYKPATLWWLSGWFGSWQQLRVLHFATVPIMGVLVLGHVLLSLKLGGLRLLRTISW